jgi:SpoIID/LytB domain protein
VQTNYSSHSRLARIAATLTAAILITALPAASGAAAKSFTFLGGGFGHSVGMSQYGAYGMARDGYDWQEIISHYYTGTTIVEASPQIIDPPLWVGLTQEKGRVDFTVVAIGSGSPAPVTVTRGAKTLTASVGDTITIEHLGNNTCRVTTPSGSLQGGCSVDLEWDGWSGDPTTALELGGCTLTNWNSPGGNTQQPCTYARGTMHVRPDNNTQSVDVALEIDIEDYVLGISESPYSWGSYGGMAALQAQAVAARSYALHRSIDRGNPADRNWCWCDVYDTSIDQVYVGWGHGTQEWIDAVESTRHMIGTHASETHQGAPMPIEAFYSSSTFGWTENSEDGFIAFVPYLRSVDDHWSQLPEVNNGSARWNREFTGSQLASKLSGVSSVTDVEITKCSSTGAALEITFHGSHGSKAFETRLLRGMLGLRSMQVYNVGSPPPQTPPCPQPPSGGSSGGGGSGGGGSDGGQEPQPDPAGPVTLVGLSLDDDSEGDSRGNGNAAAECGEIIEAHTTIRNQGGALSGVGATLTSEDPYVTVRWNTSSAYPNLGSGAEGANQDDWDLTVADNTPDGHSARLTLHVSSNQAGPWDLDVFVPVGCSIIHPVASIAVGDLDGNLRPDVVTAYIAANGRPTLSARDSLTGHRNAQLAIAPTGFDIVDLEVMPDDTSVAVLIHRPDDDRSRVVVADLQQERKVATVRYGRREVAALAVLPNIGGEVGFAVAEPKKNGRTRVAVRSDDSAIVAKVGLALQPIDMELLADLGGGKAPELAMLGARKNGKVVAITFDPKTKKRLGFATFSGDPIDVEAMADEDGSLSLLAVAVPSDGGTKVWVTDIGGDARTVLQVPIATPIDLEIVTGLSGTEGAVAVLGIAPDGAASAIVAEPSRARLLAGPVFTADATPIDLAVVPEVGPSGVALASLGVASAGTAVVSLRDAGSGTSLGELPIP